MILDVNHPLNISYTCTMVVYGIPNCNTVKKARTWLEDNGLDYTFHNYKKEGVSIEMVTRFVDKKGLDIVLNKRGTTYRKLDETTKDQMTNIDAAIRVMSENPSMIKRPIIVRDNAVVAVGFDENHFKATFTAE